MSSRAPRRRFWFGETHTGLSPTEQMNLWYAAAKGARASGDLAAEARYLATARLIRRTVRLDFDTSQS